MKRLAMICMGLLAIVGGIFMLTEPGRPARAAAPVSVKPAATLAKKTDQIRGFSIQLNNPAFTDEYLKSIDDLADMGCTWVNFVIAGRQDNVHSEAISINWQYVPAEPDLIRIFRKAKSRNMGVMFMPIVLLNNSGSKDWRGIIDPPSWDNWFASYTAYITKMATLARDCDVDVFCVGSELLSTEPFRERWLDVIAQIRAIYPGKLTYSANWDHYTVPTFWDKLDYIGMNNYNELASKEGVPVSELNKSWNSIKKDILDFVAKENKPFMFTEVGWHNLENTIAEPWNYVATGKIDLSEQEHAFESFVETWGPVPNKQFMGAFIWEWRPGSKPDDHGTYSLQGTPALDIIKKWMKAAG